MDWSRILSDTYHGPLITCGQQTRELTVSIDLLARLREER